MVIGFAVPMFLLSNVAVAEVTSRVTTSEPCLPTSAADPLTNWSVAIFEAL